MSPTVWITPMRNTPVGAWSFCTRSRRRSTSSSTLLHCSKTRLPVAFGRGGLTLRSSSSTPRSCSKFCTRRVMADCVRRSDSAAALTEWLRTTATKALMSSIFMGMIFWSVAKAPS